MHSFECPGCGKTSVLQDNLPPACPACGLTPDASCKAPKTLPGTLGTMSTPLADSPGDSTDRTPTRVDGPVKSPRTLPGVVDTINGPATPREDDLRQINYSLQPANRQADLVIDFLAPAQAPEEVGRLGPYRILEVLGRGGMGVVFKAEDPGLMRLVAIKAMLPSIARSADARGRFVREARHAAQLRDAHIVTIFHVGEEQGTPYLAMEFLEGENLETYLERTGTLPLADTLAIGRQIALGLAAAHDNKHRVIHRDIKPSNIWLETPAHAGQFQVKLLDFGLARSTHEDTQLTALGQIVGTPAYMAPEQAEGAELDQRCDLYSLGCVLYRMCTGTTPFKGTSAISLLRALALETPARPETVNPLVPPRLSDLIMSLLAKKPGERPGSALDVIAALDAIKVDEHAPHLPVDRRLPQSPVRSNRLMAGLFWAVTCLAVVVAAIVFWPSLSSMFGHTDEPNLQASGGDSGKAGNGHDPAGKKDSIINKGDPGKAGTKHDPLKKKDNPPVKKKDGPELPIRAARFLPRPPLAMAPFDKAEAHALQAAWAAYLETKIETSNSLNMKMVLIPPGEFLMGAAPEEIEDVRKKVQKIELFRNYLESEGPQHRVLLSRPFLMSAHPVTIEQFHALMKEDAKLTLAKDLPDSDGSLPRLGVNWLDAAEFCNRLSQREGLRPCYAIREGKATPLGGNGYRLPTEAEWEYACRAGSTSRYFFGENADGLQPYRTQNKLLPVGRHRPNAFGLHELVGVATTWCQDWYDAKYYQSLAGQLAIDPQGPPTGTTWCTRGGFFGDFPEAMRSARRWSSKDGQALKFITLRVVRSVDVPPAFINSLGMEFAFIPRGKAWLGGRGGKTGGMREFDLKYDFFLGTYEVTQGEWEAVMGAERNQSQFSRRGDKQEDVAKISDEELRRFPVDNVNWNDCVEFIALLNARDREKGWLYRLPTCEEWEYACRGGPGQKKEDYSYDFYLERPLRNLPAGRANFQATGLMRTTRVGSYLPNRLGLFDMHGNVFEWCDSSLGRAGPGKTQRFLCSGCWADPEGFCRASRYGEGEQSDRYTGSGLRVARVPASGP